MDAFALPAEQAEELDGLVTCGPEQARLRRGPTEIKAQ
jgi:hypothetical protein